LACRAQIERAKVGAKRHIVHPLVHRHKNLAPCGQRFAAHRDTAQVQAPLDDRQVSMQRLLSARPQHHAFALCVVFRARNEHAVSAAPASLFLLYPRGLAPLLELKGCRTALKTQTRDQYPILALLKVKLVAKSNQNTLIRLALSSRVKKIRRLMRSRSPSQYACLGTVPGCSDMLQLWYKLHQHLPTPVE